MATRGMSVNGPRMGKTMGEQMSVQRMSRREALRSGVAGLLIGVPLVLTSKVAAATPAPRRHCRLIPSAPVTRSGSTVFGHEDLSGEFEVDGSGDVSLPLIRNIKAEGLTVRQLEQTIAERLSPDYLLNPSVSVEVLNYRPFYIYGEVTKPGSYPFVSGMTVVERRGHGGRLHLPGAHRQRAHRPRQRSAAQADHRRQGYAGPAGRRHRSSGALLLR